MGAHLLCKQRVVGSSPTTSTITERGWISFGSFLKLPPTDATKEDRRLICGFVIWIRYIKKTKVK